MTVMTAPAPDPDEDRALREEIAEFARSFTEQCDRIRAMLAELNGSDG